MAQWKRVRMRARADVMPIFLNDVIHSQNQIVRERELAACVSLFGYMPCSRSELFVVYLCQACEG